MKHIGVVLASLVTGLILVAVGMFSFLPVDEAPPVETADDSPPALNVGLPTVDAAAVEANLAQREAVYQNQLSQLDQALQERQTTYQTQIQQFGTQVAAAQGRLEELQALENELSTQVSQYDAARRERLAAYQTQLAQLQEQYQARFAKLEQALTEAQSRLAEANAQLGR